MDVEAEEADSSGRRRRRLQGGGGTTISYTIRGAPGADMSHTKGALEHPSFANSLVTELNAAGGSIPGNKTVFFSHLCIKTNILPRQARDKHRENSKKDRFAELLATVGMRKSVLSVQFSYEKRPFLPRQAQDKHGKS